MLNDFAHYLLSSVSPDGPAWRRQFKAGTIVPELDLLIERAGSDLLPCGLCAVSNGRFTCEPPTAIHREWRYTNKGIDLVITIRRKQAADPVLRAMILIENGNRVHSQAIYFSEPLTKAVGEGPWTLRQVSEESECNSHFPAQVKILPTRRTTPLDLGPLARRSHLLASSGGANNPT
jgi:hypothetical protein